MAHKARSLGSLHAQEGAGERWQWEKSPRGQKKGETPTTGQLGKWTRYERGASAGAAQAGSAKPAAGRVSRSGLCGAVLGKGKTRTERHDRTWPSRPRCRLGEQCPESRRPGYAAWDHRERSRPVRGAGQWRGKDVKPGLPGERASREERAPQLWEPQERSARGEHRISCKARPTGED